MSGHTAFTWGWMNYPRVADPSMSRERMARLMRAWRRARIQGYREFSLACIDRRPGRRTYRVEHTRFGDPHTFEVISHAPATTWVSA